MLASTDGAAIFALLRSSTLERKLASTLEAESGLNDPMAVLLVLGFIAWIQEPGYGLADMAWLLVRQIGIGLAVGAAVGTATIAALRRAPLDTGGLYPVATLAAAALAFGGADTLHGSGFLAVYIAGLALGTAGIPAQRTVASFHQGLAWVAQVGCSCRSGCSCSRASSAASPCRERCSRSSSCSSRGRSRSGWRGAGRRLDRRAGDPRSPGCAGRSRSSSRRSR